MTRLQRVACMLACCIALTVFMATAQEYWGAYAEFQTCLDGCRAGYGLAWNFPTMLAAKETALAECRCESENSILITFSTFVPTEHVEMRRARCVAVGKIGDRHYRPFVDYHAKYGNTTQEAEKQLYAWYEKHTHYFLAEIVESVCNHR